MKVGDYPGAVDDYTRALGPGPDPEMLADRGMAYFFADAPRLALRDFQGALQLNPSSVEALVGRALAYVALGQDAEAIADAREAIARPCDDPMMLFNIACVFGRAAIRRDPAGQYRSQAVRALRRALDRLPPPARRPFWREKVVKDGYLDAVRRSPEFRELGERLERSHSGAIP
jgi:tetratricopeptide (TPR) repeat protein